jgi:hypothetical protein
LYVDFFSSLLLSLAVFILAAVLIHLPYLKTMSQTAQEIASSLSNFDALIREGIQNGNINEVMAEIDKDLVSDNIITVYLDYN